jgi:hypothetical protein
MSIRKTTVCLALALAGSGCVSPNRDLATGASQLRRW